MLVKSDPAERSQRNQFSAAMTINRVNLASSPFKAISANSQAFPNMEKESGLQLEGLANVTPQSSPFFKTNSSGVDSKLDAEISNAFKFLAKFSKSSRHEVPSGNTSCFVIQRYVLVFVKQFLLKICFFYNFCRCLV